MTGQPFLQVDALAVAIRTRSGTDILPVRDASFSVQAGETLALVGESGCGKSMTCLALSGLLPKRARISGGDAVIDGMSITGLDSRAMRALRRQKIAFVFQDAINGLNPVKTVGWQIAEALMLRAGHSRGRARRDAIELLHLVGMPNPTRAATDFPHQLSGGMNQRAMIALAVAGGPKLLIADEATTALDVTIQAQVLDLLGKLRREFGMAVIFVTHDLGLVAEMADKVAVMYGGRVVEADSVGRLFAAPRHPYTRGLLDSLPRVDRRCDRLAIIEGEVPPIDAMPEGCTFAPRCAHASDLCKHDLPALSSAGGRHLACHHPLAKGGGSRALAAPPPEAEREAIGVVLEADNVKKAFIHQRRGLSRPAKIFNAVDGVSLALRHGETLGIVGESGCGKSTLGQMLAGLMAPSAGRVHIDGVDVHELATPAWRESRQRVQMIFQDAPGSLDPRLPVLDQVREPLELHGLGASYEQGARAMAMLQAVKLGEHHWRSVPSELSGGQQQRVVIARALVLEPGLLILDEPVSALDVSIQAQILTLLIEMRERLRLSMIFISHDLAVMRQIADRIAVMYLGQIVEEGPVDDLFDRPLHPYAKALLSAVPVPDPAAQRRRVVLRGEPPSSQAPPTGCRFHPRCPKAAERCKVEAPALRGFAPARLAACHFPEGWA